MLDGIAASSSVSDSLKSIGIASGTEAALEVSHSATRIDFLFVYVCFLLNLLTKCFCSHSVNVECCCFRGKTSVDSFGFSQAMLMVYSTSS